MSSHCRGLPSPCESTGRLRFPWCVVLRHTLRSPEPGTHWRSDHAGAARSAEIDTVPNAEIPVVNLATHGCLALGNDPRVRREAVAAVEKYGTHTGGSRALSGTTNLHCELEERLAAFVGAARVVTYSSAYAAGVSVVSTLFGPGDMVILDRNAHRSLYDGAMLSRARLRRFAHNDLDHLDRILRNTASIPRRLVAVDSVYSMEGDLAPLPAFVLTSCIGMEPFFSPTKLTRSASSARPGVALLSTLE